jgi:CheY-like chemotaxis protein
MRIALCDADAFMIDMIEALITSAGHQVVGIADSTVDAVGLIETAKPDVVVVDISMGFNTDFDMVQSAIAVGARVIVFSHHADADLLSRYEPRPEVVAKPDLTALEQVLVRLVPDAGGGVAEVERRHSPTRAAAGPTPTGLGDNQAFFEAVNAAEAGDAMVSIDVPVGAEEVGKEVLGVMRKTDRLLVFPTAVRIFLAGGGDIGVRSLLQRVSDAVALPSGCQARSVIVGEGEPGADAFDRVKHAGELHQLRD